MKRAIKGGLLAAFLLFGATACSEYNDERGKGDAPVAGKQGEDSPAFCTNMPDDFGNVCGKCVYGFAPWAVVVTSHYYTSSNIVLFQAPEKCGGKKVASMPPVLPGTNGAAVPPEDES
jgi:hypothetical protein